MDEYFLLALLGNTVWLTINDTSDKEFMYKTILLFIVKLILYLYTVKKYEVDPEKMVVINFILLAVFAESLKTVEPANF